MTYFMLNRNHNILNTGAHFLGDVASAHVGEKYMYSGKISQLYYTGGHLSKTRKSSCVNASGLPPAAYQVLHLLSYLWTGGVPHPWMYSISGRGGTPSLVRGSGTHPWPGYPPAWDGVPPQSGQDGGYPSHGWGTPPVQGWGTGAHFLGDVASSHLEEKYMYSGKISQVYYTGGHLSKTKKSCVNASGIRPAAYQVLLSYPGREDTPSLDGGSPSLAGGYRIPGCGNTASSCPDLAGRDLGPVTGYPPERTWDQWKYYGIETGYPPKITWDQWDGDRVFPGCGLTNKLKLLPSPCFGCGR